jgi:hypothetical protein
MVLVGNQTNKTMANFTGNRKLSNLMEVIGRAGDLPPSTMGKIKEAILDDTNLRKTFTKRTTIARVPIALVPETVVGNELVVPIALVPETSATIVGNELVDALVSEFVETPRPMDPISMDESKLHFMTPEQYQKIPGTCQALIWNKVRRSVTNGKFYAMKCSQSGSNGNDLCHKHIAPIVKFPKYIDSTTGKCTDCTTVVGHVINHTHMSEHFGTTSVPNTIQFDRHGPNLIRQCLAGQNQKIVIDI